jgi:hypothetical protein
VHGSHALRDLISGIPRLRGISSRRSWLSTLRAITGTKEAPGYKDTPVISSRGPIKIVRRHPDPKGNVGWYNPDSVLLCALGIGCVMALTGIRPASAPLTALA